MEQTLCRLHKVGYAHYATRGIVLLALFCSAAAGQVNTASVTGTVTDPTGAAIPNAKVGTTNEATNVTNSAITNSAGRFTLAFMPIGTYSFRATANGFQSETKDGILLTAGQMLDLTFALNIDRKSVV